VDWTFVFVWEGGRRKRTKTPFLREAFHPHLGDKNKRRDRKGSIFALPVRLLLALRLLTSLVFGCACGCFLSISACSSRPRVATYLIVVGGGALLLLLLCTRIACWSITPTSPWCVRRISFEPC
jgi:hypothetical protein